MKVAVLSSHVSRLGGGLFSSISRMCSCLSQIEGIQIRVFGCIDAFSELDRGSWLPADVTCEKFYGPANYRFSPGVLNQVLRFKPDLIHVEGLWTWMSFVALRAARQLNVPIVITPHGMVDSWALANSGIKKKLIRMLYEDSLFKTALAWQALNKEEMESICGLGFCGDVKVIPNGIDIPEIRNDNTIEKTRKRLLFLGRLHEKKGLEILLQSWFAHSCSSSAQWELVIVGWGEPGYIKRLHGLIEMNPLANVQLIDNGVFGDAKQALYSSADAFILPSYSEGLPMTVLEAWANKLPVFMTPQCNLGFSFQEGCAFSFDPTIDSCTLALGQLFNMSVELLKETGERGYELVKKDYTWELQASTLAKYYKKVLAHN